MSMSTGPSRESASSTSNIERPECAAVVSAFITTSPTELILCAAWLRWLQVNREKPARPTTADLTLMPVRTISAQPSIARRTTVAPRVPSPARSGSQAAAPSHPPAPASLALLGIEAGCATGGSREPGDGPERDDEPYADTNGLSFRRPARDEQRGGSEARRRQNEATGTEQITRDLPCAVPDRTKRVPEQSDRPENSDRCQAKRPQIDCMPREDCDRSLRM